jgi:hypothetical protein
MGQRISQRNGFFSLYEISYLWEQKEQNWVGNLLEADRALWKKKSHRDFNKY